MMAKRNIFVLCGLLIVSAWPSTAQDTTEILHQAMDAMGGREALAALTSVRLEGMGHEFILDAFVRADGPKDVEYDRFSELRDLDDQRWRFSKTLYLALEPQGRTMVVQADTGAAAMLFAGRAFPATEGYRQDAKEVLALSPERVLFTALAQDATLMGDTLVYGESHIALRFAWQGFDVCLYLNAVTLLPMHVETHGERSADFSWRMWGEMTQRVTYYNWALESNGIRYPRQWDVSRNGKPYLSRMVTSLAFDAPAPADSFAMSDEVRAGFLARRNAPLLPTPPNRPAQEVMPGVWAIPGMFTALFIEQEDGVIVVETPTAPSYGEALLAEARMRFPNVPVKAAIVAAGAWTQFGGVRAFVEAGLPIYANPALAEVLHSLAEAPFGNEANPPQLLLQTVPDTGVDVGTGANRMRLLPVRGEQGERSLLVYFPEHRLLYASSLLIPQGASPTHWPQRIREIEATIAHHKLAVDTIFSMFQPAKPWAGLLEQTGR